MGSLLLISEKITYFGAIKVVKKIVFPLFSLFLAYLSVRLMQQLMVSQPEQYTWLSSVLIALLLNGFVTGIFAFTGFVYPTNGLLPQSYYQIHNPKRLLFWHKVLGVKYFRVLLMALFWGSRKNRKKYFDGTRHGIDKFRYETRQSEFGHFGAGVLLLMVTLVLLVKGYLLLPFLVSIINLVLNLYPVLLQRHHRMRVERMPGRLRSTTPLE